MKQEDKELLLVDLCARLPYGVICKNRISGRIAFLPDITIESFMANIEFLQPYLRPMSSMTDEEMIDFLQVPDLSQVSKKFISDFKIGNFGIMTKMSDYARNIDWLNARHFDYRGLIDKGLAISTEEFNPYKD